jgi:hypothetical protein
MSNDPFMGMETGKVDSGGKPIKCGDKVLFYERIPGYRLVSFQDALGRVVQIDPESQKEIKQQERSSVGVVFYNTASAGFCVDFEDSAIAWGGKNESLSALCEKHQWNETRITVI